jgi:hypothetical protein
LICCPECNEDSVSLCRDVIKVYHTIVNKQGLIKVKDKVIAKNELDNCWLECNSCHATSDDSKALDYMLENIDWD